MFNGLRHFVHWLITDESGQASHEYTNTLAFTALTFVLIIAGIMFCQNTFCKSLANVISGQLNQMAYKCSTGGRYY